MTRLRWLAIVLAVIAAPLIHAAPATAATLTYSVSPESGVAGTTITVSSNDPCPAPPAGSTPDGIAVLLFDHPFQVLAGFGQAPDATGPWSVQVDVSASVRNGAYRVFVLCFAHEGSSDPEPYDGFEPVKEFLVTSPPGQSDPAVRVAGVDRIGTAVAASQDIFKTSNTVDALVLSRSDSYADALAGTPLADGIAGPLLLTPTNALDPRTEQEIKRTLISNGRVYLLGGTAAIGEGVASSLQASGYDVVRLAGVNRYDTAVKVADEINLDSGNLTTVLLANGNDFHDGLIAGATALVASNGSGVPSSGVGAAGAVLLTNGETMPPETMSWLDAHGGVTRFAIGAVAAKAAPTALAVAGSNFADTSRRVAEHFFTSPAAVAFASAANFPDALSGGAHAAAYDAPLLFTDPTALPPTVRDYLAGLKSAITIAFVYGGTAAINDDVRSAIVQAIT